MQPLPNRPQFIKRITSAEIRKLYCEEMKTMEEIGSIFGVSRQRIHQLMKNYGIPRRKDHGRRLTPFDISLYKPGETNIRQLAQQLGISEHVIYYRLKKNGIKAKSKQLPRKNVIPGERWCNFGKHWQPETNFYFSGKRYFAYCKDCHRSLTRERMRKYNQRRSAHNEAN